MPPLSSCPLLGNGPEREDSGQNGADLPVKFRFSRGGRGLSIAAGAAGGPQAGLQVQQREGGNQEEEISTGAKSGVTVVTEGKPDMGETSIVNMVRRASTKVLFEPGDTRQQWKGEAAARLVHKGLPIAARYRPPVPAIGSRFSCPLIQTSASDATNFRRGRFFGLSAGCVHLLRPLEGCCSKPACGEEGTCYRG